MSDPRHGKCAPGAAFTKIELSNDGFGAGRGSLLQGKFVGKPPFGNPPKVCSSCRLLHPSTPIASTTSPAGCQFPGAGRVILERVRARGPGYFGGRKAVGIGAYWP